MRIQFVEFADSVLRNVMPWALLVQATCPDNKATIAIATYAYRYSEKVRVVGDWSPFTNAYAEACSRNALDNPDWPLGCTRVSLAQSVGLLIYLWRFPWREPALRADIGSKNFPEKSGVNDDPGNRDWHRAGGRMR